MIDISDPKFDPKSWLDNYFKWQKGLSEGIIFIHLTNPIQDEVPNADEKDTYELAGTKAMMARWLCEIFNKSIITDINELRKEADMLFDIWKKFGFIQPLKDTPNIFQRAQWPKKSKKTQ
jgi:hypothetical protein